MKVNSHASPYQYRSTGTHPVNNEKKSNTSEITQKLSHLHIQSESKKALHTVKKNLKNDFKTKKTIPSKKLELTLKLSIKHFSPESQALKAMKDQFMQQYFNDTFFGTESDSEFDSSSDSEDETFDMSGLYSSHFDISKKV